MPETLVHVLTVYDDDGDRSYFLEHSQGCPYDPDDVFVFCGKAYICDAGQIWATCGGDAVKDIEKLSPGRYAVTAVHEHTPSTPMGPEEWDAWLEVVR